jgi:hypothetical protein
MAKRPEVEDEAPLAVVPVTFNKGALAEVLGSEFAKQLADVAKDHAAQERPVMSKISLRGGVLQYMGAPVKGNRLPVVIIGMGYERTFYKDKFNPNVFANPACFALSLNDENMVPHENVENPINEACEGCKYNQWGSDLTGTRGKACKEKRRLIMIPEGSLTSAEDVQKAEIAFVQVPVMSVKGWSKYVNVLNASMGAPYFAVVTELALEPDPKSQYRLNFTALRLISDADVLRAVMGRLEEAQKIALNPYDETQNQPPAEDSKKF